MKQSVPWKHLFLKMCIPTSHTSARNFLQNNETDETLASIIDMDTPNVQEMKEPPSENIYAALAEEPGTGPYYAVTFSTTEDDLLGPIILYVNQEKEIFGTGYRE